MDIPKTLLELSASRPPVADWRHAVLLLIDAQLEYLTGTLPLDGMDTAVQSCASLLAMAREHGAPIIHVVHHGRPGAALFDPDGSQARVIPELLPLAGERVVTKHLPNGFAHTDLAQRINTTGRRELVIAGFATHMCVSTTARAALDHGYGVTIVASACAARALPNPLGGMVPAATVHMAALAELADRFATVVPSPAHVGTTP